MSTDKVNKDAVNVWEEILSATNLMLDAAKLKQWGKVGQFSLLQHKLLRSYCQLNFNTNEKNELEENLSLLKKINERIMEVGESESRDLSKKLQKLKKTKEMQQAYQKNS